MKKLFSSLAMTAAMLTSVVAQAQEQPMSFPGVKTVSAEQVLDLVDAHDDLVIIDSRKQSDYDKGHIPEVIHLVNTDTNSATLAANIASKSSPVAFYCNGITCARSGEAAQIAAKEGYSQVFWFRGGIAEWKEKGFPVEM